ncbi:hypothetical protein THAOC_31375 [Thalassiosira oceanica]|uniref:Uncharacterized protein n=1 Tax=Thalassiosira oceanica TaxID=159749 RepID=K0RSW8_THAOC|nr:hypothetical protein THAOC_31375 [Thalassiosira oceanica]|eukprot:EJK49712.1 hypothetical protein THAOC_31375 [Thalassiosira oceanica]
MVKFFHILSFLVTTAVKGHRSNSCRRRTTKHTSDELNFRIADEADNGGSTRRDDYYVSSLYIMTTSPHHTKYKVYRDGVEMTKRVIRRKGYYRSYTTTDLGDVDVCSSGSALSLFRGGVLAGAILLTKVLL